MAKPLRTLNDALGAAVQTGVPLIVRRRCSPHEVAAWTAIRFLMETTDRTAFGLREIADEMNTRAYPRVKGWIDRLVAAEVLEIVGHETLPNLTEPRPIYRIPWKFILDASIVEAEKCVAGTNKKRLARIATGSPITQLTLDFPVIDRSQDSCDRSITGPVTNGSQAPVIDRSQALLPMDHREPPFPVIDRSQHGGRRKDGGRKDDHARARESIPTPPDQWVLPQHPLDLWTTIAERERPSDATHLAALAAEHDAPTDGFGWYWLGRAMLAASLNADIRSMAKLRAVLNRWRSEAAYGSDIAYERQPPPARAADVERRPSNPRHTRQSASAGYAPSAGRRLRPGDRGYIQPDD